MIISPTLMWTFMQEIPKLVEAMDPNSTTTVGKNAKVLNSVFETVGTLTDALKSPSIGDELKIDPNSQDIFNAFNNDLKIGEISGIDYEKFNFDKGMKAFNTDIKNSDTIFNFKSNTPMSGLRINYDDDYPKFNTPNVNYTNFN